MQQLATRNVIFQPVAHRKMQRGINQMVNAIRPTLGPCPRLVAVDPISGKGAPDILDSGGLIAQRMIQIADPDEDIGAMLMRESLCQVQDQVGDGTATAAVLFGAVFNESIRYLVAGGNAVRLNHFLQAGGKTILDCLSQLSSPVEGRRMMSQLAGTICHDDTLSDLLGEVFDIIGEYGRLEIRPGQSRETTREYVEGMYWERGVISRCMLTDQTKLRTEFEDAAILISDLELSHPEQVFPVLEMALTKGVRRLLAVVGKMSDSVIGFLQTNRSPERFQMAAVATPGWGIDEQAAALQDLAILTGGRPFLKVAGDTLANIKMEDLGHARRTWADCNTFGIVGGQGDPKRLRRHIAGLRDAHRLTDDPVHQDDLLRRVGKLLGGSATLWVGGVTEADVQDRLGRAKRAAAAVREAMMHGIVPGGGVALLATKPVLERRFNGSQDADERAACRILIKAVESPFRTIASNGGHDPCQAMAQMQMTGNGFGLDAVSGKLVDMEEAGIFDPASVQKAAVYAGVFGAALALTVDVVVHRDQQPSHASIRTPGRRKQL